MTKNLIGGEYLAENSFDSGGDYFCIDGHGRRGKFIAIS